VGGVQVTVTVVALMTAPGRGLVIGGGFGGGFGFVTVGRASGVALV
jgi:hypothetical protein